jgi:hypothetical protein
VHLFHPFPQDEQLTLELSTGAKYILEKVWERDGDAGFRFAQEIDVDSFINETGPYPKRPVRLRLDYPVTITVLGRQYGATIRDLSRQGARLEIHEPLPVGQRISVHAKELPNKIGTICWRKKPAHGFVFVESMRFEFLALLAYRLQTEKAGTNSHAMYA